MKYQDATIDKIPQGIVEMVRKNTIKEKRMIEGQEEESTFIKGISKGMFINGPTGTGKTFILHALKNRLIDIRLKAKVHNWVELLLELRQRASEGYLREEIGQLCDGILMIDDLGAEKRSEWSQEIIYTLVNRCYEYEVPLFVATNLTHEQFQEVYGDRIYSRLIEMCEKVELSGEDKRFK